MSREWFTDDEADLWIGRARVIEVREVVLRWEWDKYDPSAGMSTLTDRKLISLRYPIDEVTTEITLQRYPGDIPITSAWTFTRDRERVRVTVKAPGTYVPDRISYNLYDTLQCVADRSVG